MVSERNEGYIIYEEPLPLKQIKLTTTQHPSRYGTRMQTNPHTQVCRIFAEMLDENVNQRFHLGQTITSKLGHDFGMSRAPLR